MSAPDRAPAGYRPCVGLMLVNRDGLVFAGLRRDVGGAAWQMPQGGIDPGETPREAALRELVEEVGTDKVEIVAASGDWLTYDLPDTIRAKAWGGRYVGQAQRWFVMRFTGADSDIDIASSDPAEFTAWQWMPLDDLVRDIVAFKRPVYDRIASEFRDAIEAVSRTA
jgi:putative (di)nucleoside polyphosphate hydrolase